VGFSRSPETVGAAYGTLRSQALSPAVWRALTGGGVFAEVARALLPSDVPLHLVRRRCAHNPCRSSLTSTRSPLFRPGPIQFNEQYIVKPPGAGHRSAFQWHQDSEYLRDDCRNSATVSLWTALDDTGTVRQPRRPTCMRRAC